MTWLPLNESPKSDITASAFPLNAYMLMSQAHTLQTIFTELSWRAALNMGEYLDAMEKYMRLALKAQAQCTHTLEVLAAIKNPTVVIAKQANIAHGHEQVNNTPTHTGNTKSESELLEADYEAMDTRTTPVAIPTDPQLETVGALNGGKDA